MFLELLDLGRLPNIEKKGNVLSDAIVYFKLSENQDALIISYDVANKNAEQNIESYYEKLRLIKIQLLYQIYIETAMSVEAKNVVCREDRAGNKYEIIITSEGLTLLLNKHKEKMLLVELLMKLRSNSTNDVKEFFRTALLGRNNLMSTPNRFEHSSLPFFLYIQDSVPEQMGEYWRDILLGTLKLLLRCDDVHAENFKRCGKKNCYAIRLSANLFERLEVVCGVKVHQPQLALQLPINHDASSSDDEKLSSRTENISASSQVESSVSSGEKKSTNAENDDLGMNGNEFELKEEEFDWKNSQLEKDRSKGALYKISDETMDEFDAMHNLSNKIFSRRMLPYYYKLDIIDAIYKTFMKLKEIDDVCNLFDFIFDRINIPKINIHKYPFLDWACIFKDNTLHWRMLIASIRAYAYDLLLDKVNLDRQKIQEILDDGESIASINHDEVKKIGPYIDRQVFAYNESNYPILKYLRTEESRKLHRIYDICMRSMSYIKSNPRVDSDQPVITLTPTNSPFKPKRFVAK